MRPKNPVKRFVAILLIAAVLAAQPVKQAHAFVTTAALVAAATYIGEQLLSIVTGGGKLEAMLLAHETELPIILSTVEMKINENIAKAEATVHKQKLERQAQRESVREHPADIFQANCMIPTALADTNAVRARTTTVYTPMIMGDLQHTSTGGGILGGRSALYNDKPKPTDRIAAVKQERANHICRYGTENDLKEMQATGCKDAAGQPVTTVEQIRANPKRAADIKATTLLNAEDVKDDKGYRASLDYCTNLTGNRPFNYAQGRALSEDLGNIRQFLLTLSDNASRDLATLSCAQMARNITPLNG